MNYPDYPREEKSCGANQLSRLSTIDRMLDLLTERISELETGLDRVWAKTDPVRNSCSLGKAENDCSEQPTMSPVALRIRSNAERISNLTENIERLISEIEL